MAPTAQFEACRDTFSAGVGMVLLLVVKAAAPSDLNMFRISWGGVVAQVLISGIRGSVGLLSRDSESFHDPWAESET
ncbi:hypothetical protein Slala02_70370 [Streptomyces lavendulae subsp. lavendulae]|nr:hypothetical protein Slala01_26970 [Streptomyces lavendulae subsp. lavendulae]GLX31218.1 hypothetical protein Slala02_70370 [Streptomyces lavendulae subsp. lavendulae]